MNKEDKKIHEFNKKKLYIGIMMVSCMFIVFVFFKEFPLFLFAFPASLFGISYKDFYKK